MVIRLRPISAPSSRWAITGSKCNNEKPPLEEFQQQKSWLDDAIEFIACNGKPGTISKAKPRK